MKQIWNTIKLVLAAILFFLAVQAQGNAGENSDIVTVFLDGNGPDCDRAEEICSQEAEQEEAAAICFWKEQEGVEVSCQNTGQSAVISLLTVKGNSDLAVPGTASLAWRKKGCFIDRSTAEELFGTRNADGQMIWCGKEGYTVCGTFESVEKIMILQSERGKEETLSAVSLRFSSSANARAKAEQFLMRYGLSGDIIDFVFFDALIRNFLLLFPAAVVGKLAGLLLKERRLAGVVLTGIVAAGTVFLIARRIVIPPDMVPSRWSDFSFWSEWWSGQKQNMLRILRTSLGEAQLSMIFQMIRSMVCSLAAVILVL